MIRIILASIALLLAGSAASADYRLLLDTTRLDRAVATRGMGPDGRTVRPRALLSACLRDGVFGPAAYSPKLDRCRAAAAVPGLSDAITGLALSGVEPRTTVLNQVNAGGIVAFLPGQRLACVPGSCSRELFEGATYPPNLVGRPNPGPLPIPMILTFAVEPAALVVGQSATLSWDAAEVASCQLDSSDSTEALIVPASGQLTVNPSEDTVWSLRCAAPGGTATEQTVATVSRPPGAPEIVFFAATRDDIPIGGQTRLVWDTRRAANCEISDGNQTVSVPTQGRLPVTPSGDTRFMLNCENAADSVASTLQIVVTAAAQAPTIESFIVDRSAIERGNNAFLNWRAPDATRCRLRDATQGVTWRLPPQGQMKLVPSETTDYTLDCRNAFGFERATTTLTVEDSDEPLRVLAFGFSDPASAGIQGDESDPLRLDEPGLVRVSWATEGARSCRITDDTGRTRNVPLNGSRVMRIEETTALQINCAVRGAEAQALGQIQLVEDRLFTDDFVGP